MSRIILRNNMQPYSFNISYSLMVRLLETAREDIKSDVALHKMIEKMIQMNEGQLFDMNYYEDIVAANK